MVDYVGQKIGNYQLIRLLGQGGFADVYLGEHLYLRALAAIKILHTKKADYNELEDFLREAQVISKLVHPHIVRVLEFGLEGERPFLVMEYAPNGTLRQQYPRNAQLPLTTILPWVKQIAAALQYAHDARIIHRDVKPDNILVGRNNNVLLSDFGIALAAHSSNSINLQDAAGTVSYMAPEQIQGRPCRASDQYALGVVVYEWLTGERPFQGSFAELSAQHLMILPPPLREKVPMISPTVEHIVLKTLAKDSRERYGSVEEFAIELEREIIISRSSSIADRLYEPFKQGKLLRFPRHIVLKRMTVASSPREDFPFIPVQPQIYQTVSSPTSVQLPISAGIRPAKVQVRRHMNKWQVGLLVVMIFLVLVFPFIYLPATGVLASYIKQVMIFTVTQQNTPLVPIARVARTYDEAANANGVMFGYNAAQTRVNPYEKVITAENVGKLMPYWTVTLTNEVSSVAVVNNTVYASSGNKLYAFSANCTNPCQPLWTGPMDQATVSSPAVAGNVVYISSGDSRGSGSSGRLYAFSASGCYHSKVCKPLWVGFTNNPIYSSPVVANGTVYVSSSDGFLYAFKASPFCATYLTSSNCMHMWVGRLKTNAYDTPAVTDKFVYIGDKDGGLYVFDALGCKSKACQSVWQSPIGGPRAGSLAVANGFVYTGSALGDSKSGKNFHVFSASCSTSICQPLWTSAIGGSISSSPAVTDTIVYVGSTDGRLYAFSATCSSSTCRPLWSAGAGKSIAYSSPTVANGVVFIGSEDHYVYAFKAGSVCANPCQPLWKFNLGSRIHSSPVVANGVLYIGSQDSHTLYAFHLPNTAS